MNYEVFPLLLFSMRDFKFWYKYPLKCLVKFTLTDLGWHFLFGKLLISDLVYSVYRDIHMVCFSLCNFQYSFCDFLY